MSTLRRALFFVTLLLSVSGCFRSAAHLSGLKGQQAPVVRFTALDGTYRSLYEYRGKPVVVVFWAEWCPFSKPVVGSLDKLAAQVSRERAAFVAISIDPASSFTRLRERIHGQRLEHLEHAFSGNGLLDEAYQTLHAAELPHVYVIDENGIVIEEGHDSSTAEAGLKRARVVW